MRCHECLDRRRVKEIKFRKREVTVLLKVGNTRPLQIDVIVWREVVYANDGTPTGSERGGNVHAAKASGTGN